MLRPAQLSVQHCVGQRQLSEGRIAKTEDRFGSSVPVGDFRMQPFGPEIVAMVDRHARTTAVAIKTFSPARAKVKFQGRIQPVDATH